MSDEMVDLAAEGARLQEAMTRLATMQVPLAVAAAITFHQAHGNTRAIVSRRDYDDALNIAAAALSRLVPISAVLDPSQGRRPVTVDLVRQRFSNGATQLGSGAGAITDMAVQWSDLQSALSLIHRAGLPFSFAIVNADPAAVRMRAEVDLGVESRKVREALDSLRNQPIPLALAAARFFHETSKNPAGSMPRVDYLHALEASAQALSSMVTVVDLNVAAEELEAAIRMRRESATS